MSLSLKRALKNLTEVEVPKLAPMFKSKLGLDIVFEVPVTEISGEDIGPAIIEKAPPALLEAFEQIMTDDLGKSMIRRIKKVVIVYNPTMIERCTMTGDTLEIQANWYYGSMSSKQIVDSLNEQAGAVSLPVQRLILKVTNQDVPKWEAELKEKFNLDVKFKIDWKDVTYESICERISENMMKDVREALGNFLVDDLAKEAVAENLKEIHVHYDGNVANEVELKDKVLRLRSNWAYNTVPANEIAAELNNKVA